MGSAAIPTASVIYVYHTDAERKWAYDRKSSVGHLDKGLDEAKAKGWTVVDMKKDWNRVYPFNPENGQRQDSAMWIHRVVQ